MLPRVFHSGVRLQRKLVGRKISNKSAPAHHNGIACALVGEHYIDLPLFILRPFKVLILECLVNVTGVVL